GVGYMRGTQSQLDFLPERHTDFVFAMLLEEFGMIGGLLALGLYLGVIGFGIFVAISSRNYFGKLLAAGISVLIFIYVSINAAMIMGLMPVVGMPMPLLSYGGSVMLSIMFAIGLVQNVKVHRNKTIGTNFGSRQNVK
ncbi:MAG: rod shape determining protein RodA, partial [Hyphomonadaceae bacterium]